MYLVEVYNKNTGTQSQYFAETWTKLITIFNLVVNIDTQKEYVKTIRRTEGTIKYCNFVCDDFRINIHEIQDFNEFYESESCKNCGETVSTLPKDNNIFANKISIGYLSDCECPVQIASPIGINTDKFCQGDC